MWFKRSKQRPIEKRTEPAIRFLCEQDGPPEGELKAALIPTLAHCASVRKAYLARVELGDPSDYNVALCVSGPEDSDVVKAVGSVFGRIFNVSQHLDIMFLNAEQEAELETVCRTFYPAV